MMVALRSAVGEKREILKWESDRHRPSIYNLIFQSMGNMTAARLDAHRMKLIQCFFSQQEKKHVSTRMDSIQHLSWAASVGLRFCALCTRLWKCYQLIARGRILLQRWKGRTQCSFPPLFLVHTETLIYPELVFKTVTKSEWLLLSA